MTGRMRRACCSLDTMGRTYLLVGAVAVAACTFDWDALDPELGVGGASTTRGGMGGDAGRGGEGGAGGTAGAGGEGGGCNLGLAVAATVRGTGDLDISFAEVTDDGSVYLGGDLDGEIQFAGVTHTAVIDGIDGYVARVSAADEEQFLVPVTGASNEHVWGAALTSTGELAFSGYANGSMTIADESTSGVTGFDIYAALLSADGASATLFDFAEPDSQRGRNDVAVDADDNLFLAGSVQDGVVTFGPTAIIDASGGAYDLYVTRLEGGVGQWLTHLGAVGEEIWRIIIATDDAGDAYVAGAFDRALDVGISPVGIADGYVVALDGSDGDVRWTQHVEMDAAGEVRLQAIEHTDGYVVVSGYFMGALTVGGATRISEGTDGLVLVLDAGSGDVHSLTQIGGAGEDFLGSVTVDATGAIVVAGKTSSDIDFACPISATTAEDLLIVRMTIDGDVLATGTGTGNFGSTALASRGDHIVLAVEYQGDVEVAGESLSANVDAEDVAVLRITP